MDRLKPNQIPLPYRSVSVQEVDCEITETALRSHFIGKDCYKSTRFVVLRKGEKHAVIQLECEEATSLFVKITDCLLLADADHCRFIKDPEVDTGNRTSLARAALKHGTRSSETLIVEGAFGHVNFYYQPSPIYLKVIDHNPPADSRLFSLVNQVLAFADFPAVVPVDERIDIVQSAKLEPAQNYLFPCKASCISAGLNASFLDQRPPLADWVLVGCEKSEQIYRHFYQQKVKRIETCPRRLARPSASPTIIRCCLLENTIEVKGNFAVVPWGATTDHVLQGLKTIFGSSGSL